MDNKRIYFKNFSITSEVADGTIAIFISILLFIFPAKSKEKHKRIIDWEVAKELPWGVLILFGGGLALAKGISESGLAKWLGEQLKMLDGVHPLVIVIVITIFVLFLTEVTSNTATATMILPILCAICCSRCTSNVINGTRSYGSKLCLHVTGRNTSKCYYIWIVS